MKKSTKVPKVSIGLPVHNGENYVETALDSLLRQDYQDYDIVICDNASTDKTGKICQTYAKKHKRIRYYRNVKNIGSSPNYEKVFFLAKGEYFKWHAHDDVMYPNFLSVCVEEMEKNTSDTVLVYPASELINAFGEVTGYINEHISSMDNRPWKRVASVIGKLSYGSALNGLIRSEVLKKTQLSKSSYFWDLALLSELSLLGKIIEIPLVLFQQRSHDYNALAVCSEKKEGKKVNNPKGVSKKTMKELLVWENPNNKDRKIFLSIRETLCIQFLQRIKDSNLSKREKMICYITACYSWYLSRFKSFGGRIKHNFPWLKK